MTTENTKQPDTTAEACDQGRCAVASGSASLARYRQIEVTMAFHMIGRMSELQQAERIASHYLSHAAHAQDILKIIELVRYGGELNDDTKAAIKYLTDQIRNNHAHDLGIELSWPNNRSSATPNQ